MQRNSSTFQNLYNYKDCQMYFNFKGIHSSKYNLFIVNGGDDLKIIASPDASVDFVNPTYGETTYFTGVTKKQRTFKWNVAANGLDREDIEDLLLWLDVGAQGALIKDDNPWWQYDVVLTSVGEITWHPLDSNRVIEFSLEFKTVGDWRAKGRYISDIQVGGQKPGLQIANQYGIPEIVQDEQDEQGTYYLLSVGNQQKYIAISSEYTNEIPNESVYKITRLSHNLPEDSVNNRTFVDYKLGSIGAGTIINYQSQTGFITTGVELIEQTDKYINGSQPYGILKFGGRKPYQIDASNVDFKEDSLTLTLDNGIYWDVLPETFFVCGVVDNNQPVKWDISKWDENGYPNSWDYCVFCGQKHQKVDRENSSTIEENSTFDEETQTHSIILSGKKASTTNFDSTKAKWYIGSYFDFTLENEATINTIFVEKYNNI